MDPNGTSASAHKLLVYHHDHLGSIQAITLWGENSQVYEQMYAADAQNRRSLYSYDAWGQRRDAKDWKSYPWTQSITAPVCTWGWDNPTTTADEDDLIPRGFTGHEMMDDLGLIHMNGRIYDPRLGRFLSADKYIQAPNNLQSYNRYSYVMNNPLTLTDPSGDFGIFGAAMGAVIGGAIGGGVAWWQGKSGGEIAAAAAGGAVAGALIGSGAGLVAAALNSGAEAIGGGTAILASAAVGAGASATGNVVTQVGSNMANGQSFSEAVANIDEGSVVTSAVVRGAVGAVGGGAMAMSNAVRQSTAEVQESLSSSINTMSAELTSQGASSATINQVQNQIVNGIANAGEATALTVGAVGTVGNGGITAVVMEGIADTASVADAALNNPTPPSNTQTGQADAIAEQNQLPVALPQHSIDKEELRR